MAECIVTFSTSDLYEITSRTAFSDESFLILETMDTRCARSVLGVPNYVIVDTLSSNRNLNEYASGRVFDPTGELKWQKEEETFQLVYIGNEAQAKALQTFKKIIEEPDKLRHHADMSVYLWGRKVAKERVRTELGFKETENIFIELQIPQYLCYPVPAADHERLQIQVREYHDQNGELEYYRFVDVVKRKT